MQVHPYFACVELCAGLYTVAQTARPHCLGSVRSLPNSMRMQDRKFVDMFHPKEKETGKSCFDCK